MPVVSIPLHLLASRIEGGIDRDALTTTLNRLGIEVDGFAALRRFKCARCGNIVEITDTMDPPVLCRRCGVDYGVHPDTRKDLGLADVIRLELLAVRPDIFDPGGLARLLRGYLGQRPGLQSYPLSEPRCHVDVDPAVLGPACPRPAIACAIVRGVELDDDLIKVVMNLQENLHWALGRDRKHASIGVYDLETVQGPEFRYRSVGPEEIRFVPLGYDPADPASAITPRAILEEHPKGVEFAHLLAGFERYPLLTDGTGHVLSMPPLINSEDTRVTDDTRSFFIDVTGTNRRLVGRTLNVLVTSLLELLPQARVEQVTIRYPGEAVVTPDFTPQEVELSASRTAALVGAPITIQTLPDLLRRMGNGVEVLDEDRVLVRVPAYRNDILHARDLMEDAAIAFGYHNLEAVLVPTMTVGGERRVETVARAARETLCGLGWMEVMTLVLTSEKAAYDQLRLPRREDHVVLAHPISQDQTMMRRHMLAGLLETLTVNAHREYPQRIFEVGEVTELARTDTGARERRVVGGVIIGERAGVTDVRAAAEAVLREFGWSISTAATKHETFLPGRGAVIVARKGDEKRIVGTLGELHPEVLESFKLRLPTASFEIDLTTLTGEA